MANSESLALDFILLQPQAAARQLERLQPEYTAEFLAELTDKHARAVAPYLLPSYMSQVGLQLNARDSASLLANTNVSYIAAVLRYLPVDKQNSILGHLPSSKRAPVLLLLRFAEDSVGSCMNPSVATLPADGDIGSARNYLKLGETLVDSDRIFVVNRNRALVGYVSQIELSRQKKKTALTSILVPSNDVLLARMPVQTAIHHPVWSEADVMPVNNRNGNFVGAVRHVDLRKALDAVASSRRQIPEPDNPLQGLASAYGNTFLTLFTTVEDIVRDSNNKSDRS